MGVMDNMNQQQRLAYMSEQFDKALNNSGNANARRFYAYQYDAVDGSPVINQLTTGDQAAKLRRFDEYRRSINGNGIVINQLTTQDQAKKLRSFDAKVPARYVPRQNNLPAVYGSSQNNLPVKHIPAIQAEVVEPIVSTTQEPVVNQTPQKSTALSRLSKYGNKLNIGANAAAIASEFIPGANNPIKPGLAKDVQSALANVRNVLGTASVVGIAGTYVSKNPYLAAGTAIASGLTAATAIGENAMGAIFGEKDAKASQDKTIDSIAINGFPEDGNTQGITLPVEDSEMSFTDILDNVAKGKINYETPVSDHTLSQAIGRMTNASIADMYQQGASLGVNGNINFQDNYAKSIHALLNIRDTLRTADPGSDQYRLAGIASNAMMYGQETLNAIDSNFNKDLARVNQVMKTYSTGGRYDSAISGLDKKIADLKEKQSQIDRDSEEYVDKQNVARAKAKQPPMSLSEIEDYKAKSAKQYSDSIDYLEKSKAEAIKMNGERRVGSSVSTSAQGKAIVDMWASLPNEETAYTVAKSNYIKANAKLNDVQKNALDATILAESSGTSSQINGNDGDSASVGWIQFNGPRAINLIKKARQENANPKNGWFQAKHISEDIRNPSSWNSQEKMNRFFKTTDQEEANRLITEGYIRPADQEGRMSKLRQYQSN